VTCTGIMTNGLTTQFVADFVAGASFEECAGDVEAVVSGALLDTFGVSLAGAGSRSADAVRGVTGIRGLYDIADDTTGSARADAAMLGGTAAHALDFDDYAHLGHSSAVLIPALLALDGLSLGPRRFADAYAVGYEVWERIARWARTHYAAGFHTTATVGTLGAACSAARLLGFDANQAAAAIGVAGSLAGGLLAAFGTGLKPVQAGLAAAGGVRAALLVKAGLSAPLDSLDSDSGFLAAYLGAESAASARKSLLELTGVLAEPTTAAIRDKPPAAKPYPCCAATHGAIEAALDLRARLGLADGELPDVIRVITPTIGYADALTYHRPATGLQGKFCMEYCVSVALVHGHVGLAQFTDEAVTDPAVVAMVRRVRIETDTGLDEWYLNGQVPARIEISARGTQYVAEVEDPVGGQTKPMRLPEIARKFRATAADHLPPERVSQLIDASESLGALLDAVRAALAAR
jgi:2-methylcitrate dehydratase PrpD